VEDRITPGLWLELTDLDPASYAADRVPVVLDRSGVTRATWWENAHPGRRDLPRTLPDFALLGVYEVDRDFAAPTLPDGITGLHYVHHPRPGQGTLSGEPTIGLALVLISPRHPAGADALRDWGDFVHIRHIAAVAVPGYTMITPYEHAEGGEPRFLHFYEMDTGDPETAFKSMTPMVETRLGGGPGTPAFDHWARHPELRIDYVNTFRRLGERRA
jgi:hypothetical protein